MFNSPGNEFLSMQKQQEYENIFFFKTGKNVQVQLMSFYYINIETIGKLINNFFFKFEKNVQDQLMSFCYMNVETRIKK